MRQREIRSVCLDASTVCQLKCPTCPTSKGTIAKAIGAGFLGYENFKRFVDENPGICDIELSNWGEIFLNPDLKKIIQYAYKKNVALRAENGTNFNKVTDDVLEAMVRYKFRRLTCSIDGASQEVYSLYRINGDFERVISNLRRINFYKKKYASLYPFLKWQFVAFGHNENEIAKARSLAKESNMGFYLKLSWDDLYAESFSPVKNREIIRRESGLGVADRTEFQERYGRNYMAGCCHDLWLKPSINFDGRLLGCCINYWADYGNAFEAGLKNCVNSEKLNYAKQMLSGLKEPCNDIPCSNCKIYKTRRRFNSWVKANDLRSYYVKNRRINMLENMFSTFITKLLRKEFTE